MLRLRHDACMHVCQKVMPISGEDVRRNEYHAMFLQVLGNLLEERNMQSTVRGKKAVALGKFIIEKGSHESCLETAVLICSRVAHILEYGKSKSNQLLATLGKVWKNFHKLRFNSEVHHSWQNLLTSIQAPPPLLNEAELLCQLLLDRLLKSFISEEISQLQSPSLPPPHKSTTDLNIREKNIIRYIAGYIIRKLKNRYKNIKTKNEGLQKKKEQFLLILSSYIATYSVFY